MIYSSVVNLVDKNNSLASLTDSIKSISSVAREKFLSVFWNVKKKVSDILSEEYTLEVPKKPNYNIVNIYKSTVKPLNNDSNYSNTTRAKDTPVINDSNYFSTIRSKEKLSDKVNGEYNYTNTKWKSFSLKIVENNIQEINSTDWKKVSHQQKSAIQRLINNKKLARFQSINSKTEKAKVIDFSSIKSHNAHAIHQEPLKVNSTIKQESINEPLKVEPTLKQEVKKETFKVEPTLSQVKSKVNDTIAQAGVVNDQSWEKLSQEEINRRVRMHTETLLNANKRNKVMIEVYDKLKADERVLFSTNTKKQVIIAKKVIASLSQIVPKTSEKVTNIQVNTSLLERVVNSITAYLEKTWFETSHSESSRESLLSMLRQSRYILQDVMVPRKTAGHIYEAVYA